MSWKTKRRSVSGQKKSFATDSPVFPRPIDSPGRLVRSTSVDRGHGMMLAQESVKKTSQMKKTKWKNSLKRAIRHKQHPRKEGVRNSFSDSLIVIEEHFEIDDLRHDEHTGNDDGVMGGKMKKKLRARSIGRSANLNRRKKNASLGHLEAANPNTSGSDTEPPGVSEPSAVLSNPQLKRVAPSGGGIYSSMPTLKLYTKSAERPDATKQRESRGITKSPSVLEYLSDGMRSPHRRSPTVLSPRFRKNKGGYQSDTPPKASIYSSVRVKNSSKRPSKPISSDRIEKLHVLARGGGGSFVYAARLDGWSCCIKELHLASAKPTEIADLKREIELLAELPRGPPELYHIVRFLAAQETPDTLQLYLSLYDGDLAHRLSKVAARNHYLPEIVLIKYCCQLLYAMDHLHRNAIIHRDLKASNVYCCFGTPSDPFSVSGMSTVPYSQSLVPGDGTKGVKLPFNLVLGDFGEAACLEEGSTLTTVRGTPVFSPPEAFGSAKGGHLSETAYGRHSDIWSFGQLITEMMTRKAPYSDLEMFAALDSATTGKRPKLSKEVAALYPRVILLWTQMLKSNPEERATASDLMSQFQFLALHSSSVAAPIQRIGSSSMSEQESTTDDQSNEESSEDILVESQPSEGSSSTEWKESSESQESLEVI